MTQISLTWDEWQEQFKPMKNTLHSYDPTSPAFETYGEELEFVKQYVDENKVWTMIDFGYGSVIVNGMRWINRMCYYVTEKPWDENDDYEVALYLETCETCEKVLENACIEDDGEMTCSDCCGHEECKVD